MYIRIYIIYVCTNINNNTHIYTDSHKAVVYKHSSVVEELVLLGSLVEALDEEGNTPLQVIRCVHVYVCVSLYMCGYYFLCTYVYINDKIKRDTHV